MRQLRLPKSHRLLNSTQFQFVFDQVDHKQGGSYFTFLSRSQKVSAPGENSDHHTEHPARLGIIVSKRNVPTAVARNYLKRITRETFRQNVLSKQDLPGFDVIVLAKPSCRQASKIKVYASLEQQWQKLLKKITRAQATDH